MRALSELAGVIVAGVAVFLGGIVFVAVLLLLWLMGMASALLLMVSAFGAVMWCFTGSHHAAVIALAYLGYAAVPFVLAFVFHFYGFKLTDPLPKAARFQAVPDISGLRLARDVDFNSTPHKKARHPCGRRAI